MSVMFIGVLFLPFIYIYIYIYFFFFSLEHEHLMVKS